ncbi:MAG: TetR/AcrR family transcriptional regulator [Deltaproteobacteria bacterium]|nr:TetR/AcrR family transcriptional regulator [Deltaproteobacteria bacterium]
MARPVSICDEDILDAARALFLEKGIRGTSAEVAERAGVSEGSIFKRFPSKERLFHAALSVDRDAAIERAEGLVGRAGQGSVRGHLVELGGDLHEMFRLMLPIMMMRWSNPNDPLAHANPDGSPPLRLLAALMRYLRAEMALGRLGTVDVEALARAFFGAIQNRVFFEVVLRARPESPRTSETFVAELVDVLFSGCAPRKGRMAGVLPSRSSGAAPGLKKRAAPHEPSKPTTARNRRRRRP